MANTNCLKGMRCPTCGSEQPFLIIVSTIVVMWDNGSDREAGNGDEQWDQTSYCRCGECDRDGTVADFRISKETPNVE